ncbi:MAG: Mur ligase family protein, partial [Guyparkeria sp.]
MSEGYRDWTHPDGDLPEQAPEGLVMEVSSHALALDRVAGLKFDCAVWTNLTQDHLDFHGSMEEYYEAKKTLFTSYLKDGGVAAVNIDDAWGARLVGECPALKTITFGQSDNATLRIVNSDCSWDGTVIDFENEGTGSRLSSRLCGFFNVYNIAAMYAVALARGADMHVVQRALDSRPTIPGRMERVDLPTDYAVVVDYAHTPDALDKVLETARALTPERLICVFGCGGDRDRTKRPLMAEAVARHCDEAVVTSDNPRSEEPAAIIEDIRGGIPLDFSYRVEQDRRTAIGLAMRTARAGDCIV